MNLEPIIKPIQTKLGLAADGDPGEQTWKALYRQTFGKPWEAVAPEPVPADLGIAGFPPEAVTLILEEEGLDQPGKWPGGGSGITLGHGNDIGADPACLEFWRGILTDDQMSRLSSAKGVTGRAAAQIASRYADIKVTRSDAMRVFMQTTLPRQIKKTLQTFPGIDRLPPAVLGAMTSIVYNRGTDLEGDRRREMKAIAGIIEGIGDQNARLAAIADQIQAMKRLWQNQGLDGLLKRRDREAGMVRSAIS